MPLKSGQSSDSSHPSLTRVFLTPTSFSRLSFFFHNRLNLSGLLIKFHILDFIAISCI